MTNIISRMFDSKDSCAEISSSTSASSTRFRVRRLLGCVLGRKTATRGWPNQSMVSETDSEDDTVIRSRRVPLARSSRGNRPALLPIEELQAGLDDAVFPAPDGLRLSPDAYAPDRWACPCTHHTSSAKRSNIQVEADSAPAVTGLAIFAASNARINKVPVGLPSRDR